MRLAAFILSLAWCACNTLNAQVLYSTGTGATSISGAYDPSNPIPRAPGVASPPAVLPPMPVVPVTQYMAYKSALSAYVQPAFPFPTRIEVTPPVVDPRAPAASMPLASAATLGWEGIQDTGLQPPSPDIAVGPSDALVVVNSAIAQYTKQGTLKKQTAFSDWFATVLPTVCPSGLGQCLLFDPSVRYDQLHGRFLFMATARDFNQRLAYLLLSVSNGATYDSGWKIWALDPRNNNGTTVDAFADFWRLGFDNTAVYLAGNLFNPGSGSFLYGKIRVLKKSELYNPATTTLTFADAWNLKNEDGSTASSLCPAQLRGKPSATTVGFFVNASDTAPASWLTVWKIADPLATPLTLVRSTVNSLMPYYYPAPAPQAGGRATLDSGDTRVLKVIYRDTFLYTARDSGYLDATTTATFDLIDTSAMTAVAQSRVVNSNAFYPAFDVPATTPPGIPIASNNLIFGTTTAADGSITYAGISKLKAGEGYFDFAAGGVSRWGDYFGGSLDPVNGGLWAYGEYAKAAVTGNPAHWGTWAGYFPWTTTQVFSDVENSSTYFDYINVLNTWQITTGCAVAPARFCPTDQVTRGQLGVFLIRAMFGNTFSYTLAPYFTDVPANHPYFPYIQKLRDLGITIGCTATTFCVNDPVTRAQAAVFLVRGKMGGLFGNNFAYPTTPFFTDVPSTAAEFPYIQKMFEMGITSGCTISSFCPSDILTRQQVAVFVTRAFLN
jgi:hypothetical protein